MDIRKGCGLSVGSCGLVLLLLTAGCGNGGGGAPVVRKQTATGSSAMAVDCKRNLGFVALDYLDGVTGDGLVQVLNLSVDPNTTDPRVATIDIGHQDLAVGVAVDEKRGSIYVVSGDEGNGSFGDVIDDTVSPPELVVSSSLPAPLPTGWDVNSFGGVVFDPQRNRLVISTQDDSNCPSAGDCTGFVIGNIANKSFRTIPTTVTFDATTTTPLLYFCLQREDQCRDRTFRRSRSASSRGPFQQVITCLHGRRQ